MKRLLLILTVPVALVAGCATSHNVHVAPIQVAPIRMTMDVNVNVHEAPNDDADAGAEDEAQARAPRGTRASDGG